MVNKSRAELKAATARLSEIDLKQQTEELKIDEQKLQLKLAQNNIMSAIAKKDSEISNLIMYKNEENRIKKLLKTKNATKSNYEKALANYEFSKHKVNIIVINLLIFYTQMCKNILQYALDVFCSYINI